LDTPGVDVLHALAELFGELPAGQMDIPQRRVSIRCPAKAAIACTSQPILARPVRHKCRVVCVENLSTPEASAIRRTTFDQVHRLSGWAWLRRDPDRNNGPRAQLTRARCARYSDSSTPVGTEYGTTRSSRFFVVSARIRSVR
jgi:hypothetical protein